MPGSPPDPGRAEVALGAGLAAVSGAVDVCTFSRLGRAFVSVITGNVAVMGAAVGRADWAALAPGAVAIVGYATGVTAGAVVTRPAVGSRDRWPVRVTVVCAIELVVLCGFATTWLLTAGTPDGAARLLALLAAAVAMGLQTAAFRLVGVPGVSTTYFTGTLTTLLAHLVAAGRVRGGALVCLVALAVGAVAAGLLVAWEPTYAAMFPVAMLAVVVAVANARWERAAVGRGQ